jgi:hypothetical protein
VLFYCVVRSECYFHISISKDFGDRSRTGAKVCKRDPFTSLGCIIFGGFFIIMLDIRGVFVVFQYVGYNFLFFVFVFIGEFICVYSIV